MFDSLFSFIFTPLLNKFGAGYFTAFMAFFITLILTLIYKAMTPQEKLKKLTYEIKELSKELKLHVGNQDIVDKINKELMVKKMSMTSSTLFPNLIVVVPMFFLIGWMGSVLGEYNINLLDFDTGWFIPYLLLSILATYILRKILDVA